MLGTGLAIITPLSGLIQVGGLTLFAATVLDRAAELSASSQGTEELGLSIGFYVGIVSAAIILVSIIRPFGPGFESGSVDIARRVRVFSSGNPRRKRVLAYRGPRIKHDKVQSPRSALTHLKRALSFRSKWVAMLVAFMLVSLVLALQQHDFLRDDTPMDTVGGGVALELSRESSLVVAYPWEQSSLTLRNGETYVRWTFQSAGLDGGTWSVVSLGKMSLGPLNVSLTVIDSTGDSESGPGDMLMMTAQDGTAFSEDVLYRLGWKTNFTDLYSTSCDMYATWEISFTFHEGHMDSWISEELRYHRLHPLIIAD